MKRIYLVILIIISFIFSCSSVKNTPNKPLQADTCNINLDTICNDTLYKIYVSEQPKLSMEPKYNIGAIKDINIPEVINTTKNIGTTKISNVNTTNNVNIDGTIFYNIPDTMKFYNSYTITVRITKSHIISNMTNNLTGIIKQTIIPVTENMEVKLIDVNNAFTIVPNNSGIQLIDEDSTTYTQWEWDVKPIKAGNNKLKIIVAIIKNDSRKETVYEDTILVKSNIFLSIKLFIIEYWQYLISTILLPFIIFLYNKYKENKKT